jgi:hypothetical protein
VSFGGLFFPAQDVSFLFIIVRERFFLDSFIQPKFDIFGLFFYEKIEFDSLGFICVFLSFLGSFYPVLIENCAKNRVPWCVFPVKTLNCQIPFGIYGQFFPRIQ